MGLVEVRREVEGGRGGDRTSTQQGIMLALRSPPPARGVQSLPSSKSQKGSPGESPGEFPRVLADPPKTSQKQISWRLRVKNHLFFGSGDSFLTRFSETLCWLFELGRV